MYTRCSNCRAVFRVTEVQLQLADGHVRCGHCKTVFDAMDTLSEEPHEHISLEPSPGAFSSKRSIADMPQENTSSTRIQASEPKGAPAPEIAENKPPRKAPKKSAKRTEKLSAKRLAASLPGRFWKSKKASKSKNAAPPPPAAATNATTTHADPVATNIAPAPQPVPAAPPQPHVQSQTKLASAPPATKQANILPESAAKADQTVARRVFESHQQESHIDNHVADNDIESTQIQLKTLTPTELAPMAAKSMFSGAGGAVAETVPENLALPLTGNVMNTQNLALLLNTKGPVPEVLRDELAMARASKRTRLGPMVFINGMLILLLMFTAFLQYMYMGKDELARDYRWRPWVESLCNAFDCEVPMKRNLSSLRLLSRDVVVHPKSKELLLIQATLVNTARFRQLYPVLQLKLSNQNGETIAMRRFKPEEYLEPDANIEFGMEPQTPVTLSLEVVKPQTEVTAFQFKFL